MITGKSAGNAVARGTSTSCTKGGPGIDVGGVVLTAALALELTASDPQAVRPTTANALRTTPRILLDIPVRVYTPPVAGYRQRSRSVRRTGSARRRPRCETVRSTRVA